MRYLALGLLFCLAACARDEDILVINDLQPCIYKGWYRSEDMDIRNLLAVDGVRWKTVYDCPGEQNKK